MVSFRLVPFKVLLKLLPVIQLTSRPLTVVVLANSSLTFRVKRLVALAPALSVAVTSKSKLPPALLPGVPLKPRVLALKASHVGRAVVLPAASTD